MKIIIIGENHGQNNKSSVLPFYIKPDSALIKGGKPFFIPDFTRKCMCSLHLVVRISRLGKSIPQQFANRYFDAVTLGVNFWADDVLQRVKAEMQPWTEAVSFDASAVIGEMINVDEVLEQIMTPRMEIDKTDVGVSSLLEAKEKIMQEIAQLSSYFTLREGDFLFTGPLTPPISVAEDNHLEAWLSETRLLKFNVK